MFLVETKRCVQLYQSRTVPDVSGNVCRCEVTARLRYLLSRYRNKLNFLKSILTTNTFFPAGAFEIFFTETKWENLRSRAAKISSP